MLELSGTFEDAADVLGDSPNVVRKRYAKWSGRRQQRIGGLLAPIWHTKKSVPVSGDGKEDIWWTAWGSKILTLFSISNLLTPGSVRNVRNAEKGFLGTCAAHGVSIC